MKKITILSAFLLLSAISLPVTAQKIRPGVEAGATISNSAWEFANGQNTKSVGGYTVGITLEYEILDNTWLQSGLTFLTKGTQIKISDEIVNNNPNVIRDRTETFRPLYVQVPVNVAYKFNLSQRVRLFVSGGVFLSYGIGGEHNKKINYRGSEGDRWDDENINESIFSTKALKRFDCGVNLGAGIEFGNLVLRAGYDWSLLDIAKNKTILGADRFKNQSLAIALGLKLGLR